MFDFLILSSYHTAANCMAENASGFLLFICWLASGLLPSTAAHNVETGKVNIESSSSIRALELNPTVMELQSLPRENANSKMKRPESESNLQPSSRKATATQRSSALLEPKVLPTGSGIRPRPLCWESHTVPCMFLKWSFMQANRNQKQPFWMFQGNMFHILLCHSFSRIFRI